ncbi:MAG: molybdopterin-guanine dinucleotide biosynthesis protein MobB, partial [Nitrospinota bacterium]
DSRRHKHAGATVTILSSQKMLALVRNVDKELTLNEIAFRYADDTDLLIAEGYKEGDHDKIEIAAGLPEEDLSCKTDKNIIALISEIEYNQDIPQFKRDSISEVAIWIEKRFLS